MGIARVSNGSQSFTCTPTGLNGMNRRAVLTGKHGTLVRRAPRWQGAPDDQQAKKLVVINNVYFTWQKL